MVMVPRMHKLTVRMAMRMVMEKRMTMTQRVPSRRLFPPTASVRTSE